MGKTLAQRKNPGLFAFLSAYFVLHKTFFWNEINKASSDAVLDILLSMDI